MKLASWNVNGIRAVERKGNLAEFLESNYDVIFFQETKARSEQLSKDLTESPGYFQHYHSAEKAGYSGVGLWLRKQKFDNEKLEIHTGMPKFQDTEGRIIGFSYGKLSCFGVYFPNGGKSHEAWLGKLDFYKLFLRYMNQLIAKGQSVIWCGDLNVAHNPIDLARPTQNEKNIGFLPEERSWVDKVLDSGYKDVFRSTYPEEVSYTWWDMPTRARERNVGWRIDYFMVSDDLFDKVTQVAHLNDQMGSDHCPVSCELANI